MLAVKYNHGSFERIVSGVKDVIWRDGSLVCLLADGGDYIFSYEPDSAARVGPIAPVAYVMNERGSTIARYEFHPMPASEYISSSQAA